MSNEFLVKTCYGVKLVPDGRGEFYNSCLANMRKAVTNVANNMLKIAYILHEMEEHAYYLDGGYDSTARFAKEEFGISKSTCSKYIGIIDYFGTDSPYSASQMMEMLPYLRQGGSIEDFNPKMSVRAIRDAVKDLKALPSVNSFDVETSRNPVRDIKPTSFVFNLTDELFSGPAEVYNSFMADIQTAIVNAHAKHGAKSIKIVIE